MLKYLLFFLFFGASTVGAQLNELPNFTGLVEKYGAAVVNISATQSTSDINHQMLPEIPGIPGFSVL